MFQKQYILRYLKLYWTTAVALDWFYLLDITKWQEDLKLQWFHSNCCMRMCVGRCLMLLQQKIQWTLPTVQYNFTSTWIWFTTSLLQVYSCFTVSGQLCVVVFFLYWPSIHKSTKDWVQDLCSPWHCLWGLVLTKMSVLRSGWLWKTSRFAFLPRRCTSLVFKV